jgi:uncharacterized coiled-coil protein SlyX
MKNLDIRLDEIESWNVCHSKAIKSLANKLEDQKTCMDFLHDRLDRMVTAQVDSSKLVDRLIEMSLVTRGEGEQAGVHRAQSRIEHSNFSNPQAWGEEEEQEDVWPPPGCDAMDVTG